MKYSRGIWEFPGPVQGVLKEKTMQQWPPGQTLMGIIKQLLRGLFLSGFGMVREYFLRDQWSALTGSSLNLIQSSLVAQCVANAMGDNFEMPISSFRVSTYGSEKSENTLSLPILLLMEMIELKSYAMQTVHFWSYHNVPLPSSMAHENAHSAHSI